MMVGRDRERARVTLYLDDALAGRGRLVLFTGEAGVGKTRLAEEAAALTAARGVPVAWARSADRSSSPPYGLWRLVLDEPAVRPAGAASRADLGRLCSGEQRVHRVRDRRTVHPLTPEARIPGPVGDPAAIMLGWLIGVSAS